MILLDAREFDHPVPLEMAITAFKKLSGDEAIHMIHRREPIPMFEIITKNGGRYLSVREREDLWHIYITRSATVQLEHTDV
jgi:hypothetical protein